MAQTAAIVVDYIAPVQILAPTISGANVTFYVARGANVCLRLSGAAAILALGEAVTVNYYDADGTQRSLVDSITGAAVIGPAENAITIASSGRYVASKSATAAATGLEIIQSNAT